MPLWSSPGGGTETIGGNGSYFDYLHKDWLGNSRITSNSATQAVTRDQALTPYGEIYNVFGALASQYNVFAGTSEMFDGAGVMWDTPNRELSFAGRWLSPDPAGSGWNQYAYATNPNSNVDPSGLQPCSDQASPAICQGGYYGGLSFFLNFTNWDSLEVIQVAPSGGGTYEDGGCANCMTVPAGAVQPGGGQTCYYMLVNPCGGTPTPPQQPQQPQPPKPKCSITDKLNAANKKAMKLFLRDMAVGEGGAFLVGCGIGAPAGAPFGGPIGVIGGCAGGGVAAASAALPLTTFVSGLDASIEAYSGAFSDHCD